MKPKVSIIVPVYNMRDYLEKCLDSVTGQTEKEIEIILVDDGSTDGSGDILDRYAEKDERIIVQHNKNQGISATRNSGIKAASADWLMFIDSDDWISKDAVKYLCEFIRDDADIIDGDYIVAPSEDISVPFTNGAVNYSSDKSVLYNCCIVNPKTHKAIYKKIADGNMPSLTFVWGKLYRKSVITENNLFFDSSLKRGEDQKFNIELMKHINGVVKADKIIYFYRYRESSASHKLESAYKEYAGYAAKVGALLEESDCGKNGLDFWRLKNFEIIMKLLFLVSKGRITGKEGRENLRALKKFLRYKDYHKAVFAENPFLGKRHKLIQCLLKYNMLVPVICIFKLSNVKRAKNS